MVGMVVIAVFQFERGQHTPRHIDRQEVRSGFERFSSETGPRLDDVDSKRGLALAAGEVPVNAADTGGYRQSAYSFPAKSTNRSRQFARKWRQSVRETPVCGDYEHGIDANGTQSSVCAEDR